MKNKSQTDITVYLGRLIFFSRWFQAPLYFGLIIAQAVYAYKFLQALLHLITHIAEFSESELMLSVLGLIDVVMIANLLVMVIVGGYEIFVSRLKIEGHPDEPEWMDHVNAGTMKVKVALGLVGISSIHLLQTFINVDQVATKNILWQVIIHLTFVFSALALALTNKMTSNKNKKPTIQVLTPPS